MRTALYKYIFDKWWVPILIFLFASIIHVLSLISTNKVLNEIIDFAFLSSILVLIIAGIWQFVDGRKLIGIVQIGTLVVGILGVSFISTFIMMFGPDTDVFADDKKIPKNIDLNYPIDLGMGKNLQGIRPDSLELKDKNEIEFQLYNSFQPGLYEYDLWLKSDKSGIVYLKAFEITKEIQLSKSRLTDRSQIRVTYTFDKFMKFGTKKHFTIYEGDWGKPYAARFEIWFKPDDGGDENKLMEKNYVIEGWMR